jgi:hypothetical protein
MSPSFLLSSPAIESSFRNSRYILKYTVVAFLDLFEFLFRLNKRDMIDAEIWSRWIGLAKTIMTIPKFKRVWDKTKDVHAHEFRDFVDSLDNIS